MGTLVEYLAYQELAQLDEGLTVRLLFFTIKLTNNFLVENSNSCTSSCHYPCYWASSYEAIYYAGI